MCGICGIYMRRTGAHGPWIDQAISTMLDAIDHRGGDATGLAWTDGERIRVQSAPCKAKPFNAVRRRLPDRGVRAVIGHTRFATHGSALLSENNHPISAGGSVVVHNGVVDNHDELFDLYAFDRCGDVDSEIIAHLAGMHGPGDIGSALEAVEGSAAVAVLYPDNPDTLVIARGSWSPLWVVEGADVVTFASTPEAARLGWYFLYGRMPRKRRVTELAEGEILTMTPSGYQRATFTPRAAVWSRYLAASQGWSLADVGGVFGIDTDGPDPQTTAGSAIDAEEDRDVCVVCGLPAVCTIYESGHADRVCDDCAIWLAHS